MAVRVHVILSLIAFKMVGLHHLPLVLPIPIHFEIITVVLLNDLITIHRSGNSVERVSSPAAHRSIAHLVVLYHFCVVTVPVVLFPFFVPLQVRLVVVGLQRRRSFMPASNLG